ncbi:MAG: hypothetical protein P9L99_16300 [Candidatus Lernaella stagnicola]|nr:hypothetical protein [Candidatus Lernaella stagnicola]
MKPFSRGRWLYLAAMIVAMAGYAVAAEPNIAGTSTTVPYLFSDYIQDEQRSYVALYEYLDFSALNLGTERLDVYFAGWGRADAADKLDEDDNAVGDAQVTSAFLRWRDEGNRLDMTLGRRYINIGPAAEAIDSLAVDFRPIEYLGLEGFGGVPVYSEVGERDGDYGAGARLHAGWRRYFEFGASTAALWEKGESDRLIFGGDFGVWPVPHAELLSHGYYDFLFGSWYDVDALLIVRPMMDMKILGRYEREMPSAFLGMGSWFSIFSYDSIDKLSGETSVLLASHFNLAAEYNRYVYDHDDPADRYGGSFGVVWGERRDNSASLGVHRLRGGDRGYFETRAYAVQRVLRVLQISLDLIHYRLDEEMYGVDQGFDSIGSLGWDVSKEVALQGSGMYRISPYYAQDVRGLLKLTYRFGDMRRGAVH